MRPATTLGPAGQSARNRPPSAAPTAIAIGMLRPPVPRVAVNPLLSGARRDDADGGGLRSAPRVRIGVTRGDDAGSARLARKAFSPHGGSGPSGGSAGAAKRLGPSAHQPR